MRGAVRERIGYQELMVVGGGVLLGIALFLPWYRTEPRGDIDGAQGRLTGFEVHDVQRWLLLAAAVAPLILIYILVRDHKLSWARGELTAVTSIAAFGLVAYTGIIDLPGDFQSLVSRQYGLWIALLGTILMLVGSALRASSTERRRKPPGVL